MDFHFENKVAIVTGASSGIGLACAELVAASGAKVALIARNTERLEEAGQTVQKKGASKEYRLDVADIAAINPIISEIRADLGEIDILFVAPEQISVNQPMKSLKKIGIPYNQLIQKDFSFAIRL